MNHHLDPAPFVAASGRRPESSTSVRGMIAEGALSLCTRDLGVLKIKQAGLPVRLLITPGQASDKPPLPTPLDGLPGATVVIADHGYDSRAIVELVAARGGQAHIPT